jgi:hypothetical protein
MRNNPRSVRYLWTLLGSRTRPACGGSGTLRCIVVEGSARQYTSAVEEVSLRRLRGTPIRERPEQPGKQPSAQPLC